MGTLMHLWYVQSPAKAWSLYLRTVTSFEVSIGVRDMIRNIRRPLFQDYTWGGRLVGLLLRVGRILFGLFLYAAIGTLYACIFLLWLLFPVICIASITGAFLGSS